MEGKRRNEEQEKSLLSNGSCAWIDHRSAQRINLCESSVAEVTVTNVGATEIRNWEVVAAYTQGSFVNVWNATMKDSDDAKTFVCQDFNRVIKAGEAITFGYQMENGNLEDLEAMKLVQKSKQTNDEEDYSISYRIVNEWSKHAIVEVDVYNNTDKAMEDWQVEFDYDGNITNIWNGKIIKKETGSYTIKNMDYNAVIPANGKVGFGFEVEFPSEEITCPQNGKLSSVGEGEAEGEAPVETTKPVPEKTEAPETTGEPVATETPEETEEPQPTEPSVESEDVDGFDPEDDAYVYRDVENRDWNMEMINADADIVKNTMKNPKGAIRVALLDSGINYSDEVYVSMRKDFVTGCEEHNLMFDDISGHGTAIAEVLASNPGGTPVDLDEYEEEDEEEYTYIDDGEELVETEGDYAGVIGDENYAEGTLLSILDSGYEWTEGVNPTVDLISAKVLDENNETTVDRVVEAIDWAMENDTNIISMSFGMKEDSAKLHKAIKKAKKAGILIVAAAGNGDEVEYPAAYEEVMAVGSVDSMAEQADQSASGNEVDVVAPGEFIVSRGVFDSMQIFSGTSMAVPHVVGLASILWQKDTTKSPEFIRQLICATARECGEADKYGHGVIDCEQALLKYDEFAGLYVEADTKAEVEAMADTELESQSSIDTDADVRSLYGNWLKEEHAEFVSKYAKEEEEWSDLGKFVDILKQGVVCVDFQTNPGCYGMRVNPWFHGYYGENGTYDGPINHGAKTIQSNYFASYHYLYRLAKGMYDNKKLDFVNTEKEVFTNNKELKNSYDKIEDDITKTQIGSQTWGEISAECKNELSYKERSMLLFGIALHTATDVYAHSTYRRISSDDTKIQWGPITHKNKDDENVPRADSKKYYEKRYKNAKRVAKAIMSRVKVDPKNGHGGFKSSKKAISVFTQASYYDVDSSIVVNKSGAKVLIMQYLKKAYALKKANKYLTQLEELSGVDQETLASTKKVIEKVALDKLRKKLKSFKVYTLTKKNKAKGKYTAHVYDSQTGEKMLKTSSNAGNYTICATKSSNLRTEIRKAGTKKRFCCILTGGLIYSQGGKIIEDWKEKQMTTFAMRALALEDEDEEEIQEMCGIYNGEYELEDTAYRIELSWDNKDIDLDSMLVAAFPQDEYFYMTYFVEKTFHPELADVFQKDDRAEIVKDVKDGSEPETTKIYNLEADGYYYFMVCNHSKNDREELSLSGATIRVYSGNETTPVYTCRVPKGEGYCWNAFCILGNGGYIVPVDEISDNAFGYEP